MANACTSHSYSFLCTLNNNIGFVQSLALGKPEEREHLENLGIDASIILKWILKKEDGRAWTGLIWLKIGTNGRT